jgi:trehalose 6-phosphate phosphatase
MRQFRVPPEARIEWAYFLDVDGTLIDIAETPDSVSDLKERLGTLHLPMAGQHGLERRDAAGRLWMHAAPPAAKTMIKEALAPILARHPLLLLEDKGLTLALHYRRAPHLAAYAQRLMARMAQEAGGGLEVQHGKRVVELKPSGLDKGTAVAEYLAEPPFVGRKPVFIGDDRNDEHGFAEVNRLHGVSIKVGKGSSCARYRLSDVAAVRNWLGHALKDME